MLKKIPLPITGVALGMAALGNLLQSYSEGVRTVCGVIAGILLLLYLIKIICYPKLFAEDMKNPIMASVFGTFSMALMLLAAYVKPLIGGAAVYVWYFAILVHVALIVYFTVNFIFKLNMQKVFASYYIVYVGIVVASISAPAFEQTAIGNIAFWFGFATLILLLVLVTYRYVKFRAIPEPARPLFCIYTAPASLCLAGYIQSVAVKSTGMIGFMAVLSLLLYVIVLISLPRFLKLKFYPSYAAFTFPFVISAIAMKQTAACLTKMGTPIPALSYVVIVQTVIAAVLVLYALVRFVMFIVAKPKAEAAKA